MKMLSRYILFGVALTVLLAADTGCNKTLDVNKDPNNPTLQQGTPGLVFPVAVFATTGYVGGNLAIVGGMWSQYFTQAALAQQYTDVDSYNMPNTDGFVDGTWDVLFSSGLKNYQYVIANADSSQDWVYGLMGTVMKVYTAEVLVDVYGEIPYTQALQGTGNLNPKFDSAYTTYTDMIAELDAAMAHDFTASTNSAPGTQDPIFGGTVSQWIAFANTLKLKMYLRMATAHPDVAQAGIQAMWTASAPFLTTDAAFTNFTDNPGLDNPLYEQNIRQLNTPGNIRASKTFVTWLEENGDGRAFTFFGTNAPIAIHQGDYHSSDATYPNAAIFVERPTDTVEFISLPESYFLQAEADVRYNGGANAKTLYDAGVMAAFSTVGQDGSHYIAAGGPYEWGHEVEGGQTLTPIAQIIRQKWASNCFGCHGIEGFFDWVRTGFPKQSNVYSTDATYIPGQLVVAKNSVLPAGSLPQRMVYPYDETSRNTNAPAPVPMTTAPWYAQ